MIKLRQYHQDLLRQVQDALEGNAKAWGDDAVACRRWQDHYREGTAGRQAHGRA